MQSNQVSTALYKVYLVLCFHSLVSQRQKADEKMTERVAKEAKKKERDQMERLRQQRRAEVRRKCLIIFPIFLHVNVVTVITSSIVAISRALGS